MYPAITAQTREMEAKIERYEAIMKLTSGNLRDLAISVRSLHLRTPQDSEKDFSSLHELANRLYNATLDK